ncbi:MAG: patatin-like phospholipase family protein [Betaproteobacteria bacterium]|nr:patatin-like phospholipase family protein [Betaproteobacteria bacterium]
MGKRFQILALSGGGYRGLFSSRVLELMEEQYGGRIADRFDLIAGTSIGGILALALALRIPAARLTEIFKSHGSRIFHPRSLLSGWLGAKYDNRYLKALLSRDEFLGGRLLGESRTRLLIPAVNYTSGAPQLFKTPHHANFGRDHRLSMVDVALATSAAPTFFPIYELNSQQYVDGGLVANAPGLLAVHEAREFLGQNPTDVHVLAVGTITSQVTADPTATLNRGKARWASSIFELTISAQESLSKFMLSHSLGERYMDVDVLVTEAQSASVGLDKTDEAASSVLIGRANHLAQQCFGRPDFRAFMSHKPDEPAFYHGPNQNIRNSDDA